MSQIGKRVLDQCYLRLTDPANGFNSVLAANAASYGIDPFELEFDKPERFIFGQLNPEQLHAASFIRYPFMCMYVVSTANQNLIKFTKFSGEIVVGIDLHLSWGIQRGVRDFEAHGNVCEQALVHAFNFKDAQNWGAFVVYNGGIIVTRSPLELGGDNWRQMLNAELIFHLDTE